MYSQKYDNKLDLRIVRLKRKSCMWLIDDDISRQALAWIVSSARKNDRKWGSTYCTIGWRLCTGETTVSILEQVPVQMDTCRSRSTCGRSVPKRIVRSSVVHLSYTPYHPEPPHCPKSRLVCIHFSLSERTHHREQHCQYWGWKTSSMGSMESKSSWLSKMSMRSWMYW